MNTFYFDHSLQNNRSKKNYFVKKNKFLDTASSSLWLFYKVRYLWGIDYKTNYVTKFQMLPFRNEDCKSVRKFRIYNIKEIQHYWIMFKDS